MATTIRAILLTSVLVMPLRAADPVDRYVAELRRHNIGLNPESIGQYLLSINPDGDAQQRLQLLIQQLGDDSFSRREAAMRTLLLLPTVDLELLNQAAAADDPEIRWRAKRLLKQRGPQNLNVMYAALFVVRNNQLKGLAKPLLAALPLCQKKYWIWVSREALKMTVLSSDGELLRQSLKSKHPQTRVAAIVALERLQGPKALNDIRPMLNADDDQVRCSAALTIANHGDRTSLPVLGRLLNSDDVHVRARSAHALRALTGRRFRFTAYETDQRRADAGKSWNEWIGKEGATAKLNYPIESTSLVWDRLLVCHHGSNRVYELDAKQKTQWQKQVPTPWGCYGMPNGHRLISSQEQKAIIEFDESGKEVWRVTDLRGKPWDVRRLPNGNTLVTFADDNYVLEYKPDKSIAWRISLSCPIEARRLPNGNTLVTLYQSGRIIEIDRSGNVFWELRDRKGPRSAQRLDNGNTLVCEGLSGQVVEVDPNGQVVWSKTGMTKPFFAQRLADGKTMISAEDNAMEVDADGKVVWQKTSRGFGRFWRY